MEIFIVLIWIVFVWLAVVLAKKKGRSVAVWVILTIIFAPFLFVLMAMSAKE